MTREQIIEMAREAGFHCYNGCADGIDADLERFAELVRKDYSFTHAQMWLKRFDDAIKAEREACAKVCEEHWEIDGTYTAKEFAALIRARGQA